MSEGSKKKSINLKKVLQGTKKTAITIGKKVGKKSVLVPLSVVVIAFLAGYGIFVAGEHRGAKRQAALDAKKRIPAAPASRPAPKLPDGQVRKSVYGTVTNVSGSTIQVKAKTGGVESTITSNKDTQVFGQDGKKVSIDSIKKDQLVIISGIADKNGKITAQRIRIQK